MTDTPRAEALDLVTKWRARAGAISAKQKACGEFSVFDGVEVGAIQALKACADELEAWNRRAAPEPDAQAAALADRLEKIMRDLRFDDARHNHLRLAMFMQEHDADILRALRALPTPESKP